MERRPIATNIVMSPAEPKIPRRRIAIFGSAFAANGSTSGAVVLLVLAMFASLIGCESLKPMGSTAALPTMAADGGPAVFYSINVHSNWGKPKMHKEAYVRAIPLQEALEKANAIPRHGGIEVSILRVIPETGKQLVLKADYDVHKKVIATHQNYDVLPNDHIVVKPVSESPFDEMLKPLTQLTGG